MLLFSFFGLLQLLEAEYIYLKYKNEADHFECRLQSPPLPPTPPEFHFMFLPPGPIQKGAASLVSKETLKKNEIYIIRFAHSWNAATSGEIRAAVQLPHSNTSQQPGRKAKSNALTVNHPAGVR